VFSFIALFAFEADELHCWTIIRLPDGTVASQQVRPEISAAARTMSVIGPGDCTSDIVSNREGTRAFVILSAATLSFVVAARLGTVGARTSLG